MSQPGKSRGPWIYTDPLGNEYVVQIVPLENDPTLPPANQPHALCFQGEDGWIAVTPVGPGFRLDDLDDAAIQKLFRFATDRTAPAHWKLIQGNSGYVVAPNGRMFRVSLTPRERSGGRGIDSRSDSLVFEATDGTWIASAPVPRGVRLEDLSMQDLERLLKQALEGKK